jgi:hypothetical protein
MTVYPNLNLLRNTRTLTATSTSLAWNTLFSSDQIYDSTIKSKTGVSAMNFSFDVFVPLNTTIGGAIPIQIKGQTSKANSNVGSDDFNTLIANSSIYVVQKSDLGKTIRISVPMQIDSKYKTFDSALADTDSLTVRQVTGQAGFVYSKLKLEIGSTATPYMPSFSEVKAEDYPSYIGTYTDNKSNEQSTDPEKYTWEKIE